MAKISESVIEQIKSRLTISEVVSAYVNLTYRGGRHWGLCPFHHEKTASFSVLNEKGLFHCFGCGKSGSMFDFVMEMDHLTFGESVSVLARKAGVELREETPEDKRKRTESEALQELYDRLTNSFRYILQNSDRAAHARRYLENRGISLEIQEKFGLGYAPAPSQWLYDFLTDKHYSASLLEASGLFSKRNERVSIFRDRLMFPIRTWQGKTVGFGGRDLTGESTAKYINTPETAIYSKRSVVYGLYEALSELKSRKHAILCEGYFDVMAMHQSGFTTAVAPLGTAFTTEQCKQLHRYCDSISTLFDSDAAGQNATGKALVICQDMGIENNVMLLDHAKDAADVLEKNGSEALGKMLENKTPGFEYLVLSAINMYDVKTPKGKSAVFSHVRSYLEATDSEIERQTYIHRLAEILHVDDASIVEDLHHRSSAQETRKKAPETSPVSIPNLARVSSDMFLMLCLATKREEFPVIRNRINVADLEDSLAVDLFTLLEDATRNDLGKTDEVFLQMIDDERLKQLVAISFQSGAFGHNLQKGIDSSLDRITLRKFEKKKKAMEDILGFAENETPDENSSEIRRLVLDIQEVNQEIIRLRGRLGAGVEE
ncbi:DNA primase [Parasphaerochaeta coccoides]|uniref:DNA primase n=1 Tax=Parasphaerochaeta coccoides (strain ATCC BAA-1237 / DSM 17374 / SPN1) TaxID=760011 RepID=F4GKT4_PARC1|nr:DNA primase [Parasphaerochaeta coccoides]AEC01847.1 DNA primase [Parasphaerochaeta coccoides DSM 17374]